MTDDRTMDDDIHAAGVIPCVVDLRVPKDVTIKPGEVPESERLDIEKTNEARRAANEVVGGGLFGQSMRQIFQPDPAEVAVYGELTRTERDDTPICLNCRAFDMERGRELLLGDAGARVVLRSLGVHILRTLGDPREYGVCKAAETLKLSFRMSPCPKPKEMFQPKGRAFGRILGGVWKRITEI